MSEDRPRERRARRGAHGPAAEPPANGRSAPQDLVCFVREGWRPLVRPAPSTRAWMDATQNAYAYRCLPLNIANSHGWEVLNPVAFRAVWDGGESREAIRLAFEEEDAAQLIATSHFGHGVLTFHVNGLFRTPPGWNLWVGGPANRPKDAIQPLTGIVEADWSPFTFTMNWMFTRPGWVVEFAALEPICSVFPIPRAAVEAFEPRFAPMEGDAGLSTRFNEWGSSRSAFNQDLREGPRRAPSSGWQKHYYRGIDFRGAAWVDDHKPKLRLRPFDRTATPSVPEPPDEDPTPRRKRT